MLDVFRFAWFAVRTFAGFVLLVLTLYAALWLFVKILSAAPGTDDHGAALQRVKSYSMPASRPKNSKGRPGASLGGASPCIL
jgi:hypothetical protein